MSKLSLLLAIALATPALAQDTLPDIHVAYRDLNLANPEGVRILDRRIAGAAERACANLTPTDLRTTLAIVQCRQDKIAEASAARGRALAEARSATRVASAR